ncbi:unnamed protein product [Closterium sp. NIES-54]
MNTLASAMQLWEETELVPLSVRWETDLPATVSIAVISLENDQPLKKIVSPAVKDLNRRFSGAASFLVDASLLRPSLSRELPQEQQEQQPQQQELLQQQEQQLQQPQQFKRQQYPRLFIDFYSCSRPLDSRLLGRATLPLEAVLASQSEKGSYDVVQPGGIAGRQSNSRGIAQVHVRSGSAIPLPRRGQADHQRLANVQSIMNPARFALPATAFRETSQDRRHGANHAHVRTRNGRNELGLSNAVNLRQVEYRQEQSRSGAAQEAAKSGKENVPPVVVIRNPDGMLEGLGFLVVGA